MDYINRPSDRQNRYGELSGYLGDFDEVIFMSPKKGLFRKSTGRGGGRLKN